VVIGIDDLPDVFPYRSQYRLGIRKIDEQHQQMFALGDDLLLAVSDGVTGKRITRSVDKLARISTRHFADEEGFLFGSGYPIERLQEHIKEHRAFSMQLELMRSSAESTEELPGQTRAVLKWIVAHTTRRDAQYAQFLKHRQAEHAPYGAADSWSCDV
jgi:hemerythrin